jgi:hypothetical protein
MYVHEGKIRERIEYLTKVLIGDTTSPLEALDYQMQIYTLQYVLEGKYDIRGLEFNLEG